MIKKKTIASWSGGLLLIYLIFLLSALLYFTAGFTDVVWGTKPVRKAEQKIRDRLEDIALSNNKEKDLNEIIMLLPVNGKSVEEKVANWLNYNYQIIDSIKFKLLSGLSITVFSADKEVRGYTSGQVVVEIYSLGRRERYFLASANTLVAIQYSFLTTEIPIGKTIVIKHELKTIKPIVRAYHFKEIPPGGSLCGTLGMSRGEALHCAEKFSLPYWYKKKMLIVLVYPNDRFILINNHWEPLSLE